MQRDSGEGAAVLSLRGISRSFGTTRAVQEVDLDVAAGTVHALLGENGAGKSTLMNVVYGVHPADAGWISVDGRDVRITSPRQALGLGIAMVHQHHQLIPSLTVAESVTLAAAHTGWRYDKRHAAGHVQRLADRLGITIDAEARVSDLSLGDRQRLEILSAIDRDSRVVILDEPTAVLAPTEIEPLFRLLRKLAADGRAVVLITHRMREVFAASDAISVMRKGRLVDTLETARTTPDEVLGLVIPARREASAGATVLTGVVPGGTTTGAVPLPEQPTSRSSEPALEVDGLVVPPAPGTTGLDRLTFEAFPGEILGIVGVEGNGQHELVEVLAGIRVPAAGSVRACGQPQRPGTLAPCTAIVPEDRHREALVLDLSIEDNLVLPVLGRYTRGGLLKKRAVRQHAQRTISEFAVVAGSSAAPTRSLSGGNQQKLVLARALDQSPRVLVASQATRGLDPGATAELLDRLRQVAAQGTCVVYLGSDLDEVVEVSDRVAVMYGGAVVGQSTDPDAERDTLAALMVGGGG
ncbi:ABC transporter ATP-binding protein [Nocardioides caldifontis]|uniref:ABC transporter ATP-binding protein n=1 Tax=Nocardioides caldifontis TaxID=2588938 RepID=UPI0011E0100E|nr:ABC transporter ATP-binding protein [Nocardioides caldifontis]